MRYNQNMAKVWKYICEKCGRTGYYRDPEQAFLEGWDIPPHMGKYGVVSPRTCPDCDMTDTLWWKMRMEYRDVRELNEEEREVLRRILNEPESLQANPEEMPS